ncbi:hypothetical protein FALBO_12452 [Fusarium albosuccineum]|uniref:Uncharacterized protein n=1 Tax=Fusarium albosuccineum TaxID=1237068 RepID=A0A8H4P693_9HYPO|nr:hypothetical protein FALBO_12452 [Fusarium albosuccineum]
MQLPKFLLLVFSVCITAQKPTGNAFTNFCSTSDISAMNVRNCTCSPRTTGCILKQCSACGRDSFKKIKDCNKGCRDDERVCQNCQIWFHDLCQRLKRTTGAITSGEIKKNGDAIWLVIETAEGQDNLITSTRQIPGILELVNSTNRNLGDEGFVFAQQQYDPASQALALNSWRARAQEQVHIHVCNLNKTMRHILSTEARPMFGQLTRIRQDPDLWCMARLNGASVRTFATTLFKFLDSNHPGVCDKLVGAGIMRDARGDTWACASTNSKGMIGKFCAEPRGNNSEE